MSGPFIAPQPVTDSLVESNTSTIAANTGSIEANQTNASQKTQIVDGSGNVIASTSNALDVSVANASIAVTQSTSPWVVSLTSTTITGTVAENLTEVGGSAISLGQATMANSLPVVIASDQTPISVTSSATFSTNAYTVTTTGMQSTVDIHTTPLKTWSIAIKGTGAVPTSWTVNLEGSLDGTNFTTYLQHTNTTESDGSTLVSGTALMPALYYRVNTTALSLGSATNIVVRVLGV